MIITLIVSRDFTETDILYDNSSSLIILEMITSLASRENATNISTSTMKIDIKMKATYYNELSKI